MTLEQQVCSLELSKRLKELGVGSDGPFVWIYFNDDEHEPSEWWQMMTRTEKNNGFPLHRWMDAFTVAELGEILPRGYVTGGTNWDDDERLWCCHWYMTDAKGIAAASTIPGPPYSNPIFASSEADARAKMLIYLVENKLITL